MSDKWKLYSQVGVDGQEHGIKIRPGYIVTGFQKEDAEEIIGLHEEVERLRSAIPEAVDAERDRWLHDYQQQATRIKELSDLNESLMENGNNLRARCHKAEARIKELEAKLEHTEKWVTKNRDAATDLQYQLDSVCLTAKQRQALVAMSDLRTTIPCPSCGAVMDFHDIKQHMDIIKTLLKETL